MHSDGSPHRRHPAGLAAIAGSRYRDLAVFRIEPELYLVAACDAVGGIGKKPGDGFVIDPHEVGYFCARVCLVELFAVLADPFFVSCTCSTERTPTGDALVSGVNELLSRAGLEGSTTLLAGSETNFATTSTGLGVTMLGTYRGRLFPARTAQPGDAAYLVGALRTGVSITDDDLVPLQIVRDLASQDWVNEVIPLGSKGISGEIDQLRRRGLGFEVHPGLGAATLTQGAGPAGAVLVFVAAESSIEDSGSHLLNAVTSPHVAVEVGRVDRAES